MQQNLIDYYNRRAMEYDRVYAIPEEQADLRTATELLQQLFAQQTVLEIACGTGYWTQQMAATAASVHATDINESMLAIARGRNIHAHVSFEMADMYGLRPAQRYQGLFGGFIWSHIPLQELAAFLQQLASLLQPGGSIAFIDSKPVSGGSHDAKRITHTDEQGNTLQTRQLDDGTSHLVLKNFPNPHFLTQQLSRIATNIRCIDLPHYWIATGQIL
jgi:ubiquinone/menaquinone biosynthesis C-methylase UbiE